MAAAPGCFLRTRHACMQRQVERGKTTATSIHAQDLPCSMVGARRPSGNSEVGLCRSTRMSDSTCSCSCSQEATSQQTTWWQRLLLYTVCPPRLRWPARTRCASSAFVQCPPLETKLQTVPASAVLGWTVAPGRLATAALKRALPPWTVDCTGSVRKAGVPGPETRKSALCIEGVRTSEYKLDGGTYCGYRRPSTIIFRRRLTRLAQALRPD